ncbi:uncharacterized protein EDB91DRAFT_1059443, partial [Suillus paluster]|uniref:uncharacterized protein n=1 Tax=Suillus paluster TaxID=48578 RepID=UPI001B85DDE6
ALPPGCDRTLIVQAGDTCNKISAEHKVPIVCAIVIPDIHLTLNVCHRYQLMTVNPDIDPTCSNLYPGQVLCLGIAGQDCDATYVVQYGDICYKIIYETDIPLKTLYTNNPKINANCTNLYPDEVLCTASHIYYSQEYAFPL